MGLVGKHQLRKKRQYKLWTCRGAEIKYVVVSCVSWWKSRRAAELLPHLFINPLPSVLFISQHGWPRPWSTLLICARCEGAERPASTEHRSHNGIQIMLYANAIMDVVFTMSPAFHKNGANTSVPHSFTIIIEFSKFTRGAKRCRAPFTVRCQVRFCTV
eukprot:scaffold76764_cov33-Attheya_sp.AAC.1